ncbi:MAG: hypothetical protein NTX29_16150 [Actinobacteria bacterium]|nr:hypothetical protein [Actinomycetota bacterium]
MTIVAGVDIGNSTTEIVIADSSVEPPLPVAWDRAPTRGAKGSAESARGAAALLNRLERRSGSPVERVLMTPQVPVHTRRIDVPTMKPDTGVVTLLSSGVATPAGNGAAVGHPWDATGGIPSSSLGPVVLVARDPLGYRSTVERILEWRGAGHDVVAVLLAGDEAALVAARTGDGIPIVDGVDADATLACVLVAVEVARGGNHVRALADPIWLASALALDAADHGHVRAACAMTYGHRCAVIGRRRDTTEIRSEPLDEAAAIFRDGRRIALMDALPIIAMTPVGGVCQYLLSGEAPVNTDDLWLVDLDDLSELSGLRSGSVHERRLLLAALSPATGIHEPAAAFSDVWGGRIDMVGSEAQASRAGALTTPGVSADAWVVDLGGGTIDAIGPLGESLTAAGCGELMTSAVAHTLSISAGAAEWVKRGPASRVDSPFVRSDESGERRFAIDQAPHGSIGWITTSGPSGDLPFSRTLALAEWRAIRLALKRQVFATNLSRILAGHREKNALHDVIVIGGPAGDDEILEALNPALGAGVVGRADVAAALGHRWAVAYGLVVLGTETAPII